MKFKQRPTNDEILKTAQAFLELKGEENNEQFHISHIMAKNVMNPETIVAYAISDETAVFFYPYNPCMSTDICWDWDFSIDGGFLKWLEEGFTDIIFMDPETHFWIWNDTSKFYPEDIACKKGLKIYLDYCRSHGIDRAYMEERFRNAPEDIFDVVKEDCIIQLSPPKVNHLAVGLFDKIVEALPTEPGDHIWTDGNMILCPTMNLAESMADILDAQASEKGNIAVTGYYDPEEDERCGETDNHTGFWYVEIC